MSKTGSGGHQRLPEVPQHMSLSGTRISGPHGVHAGAHSRPKIRALQLGFPAPIDPNKLPPKWVYSPTRARPFTNRQTHRVGMT